MFGLTQTNNIIMDVAKQFLLTNKTIVKQRTNFFEIREKIQELFCFPDSREKLTRVRFCLEYAKNAYGKQNIENNTDILKKKKILTL